VSPALAVLKQWRPSNFQALDNADQDVGSIAPGLIGGGDVFQNGFTQNTNMILTQDNGLHFLATMGDPMKDKARYQERSPINFVDQIKAPLLLLAGGNDPRCPHTEAEQVASAVKKRGGVVELKVYENEGHGFAKIENQIDAYTRVANFLKKYAEPAKCGCNIYE
jgi:dipeptidyl aminopeptidase/acylaminoacyl peptidase